TTNLSASSKTLKEGNLNGYTNAAWSCDGTGAVNTNAQNGSVVLGNGESVICTITNSDQAASLTIVKKIVNANGGAKKVGDFGITTNAGALTFDTGAVAGSTTTYTSNALTNLSAGTKSLHERSAHGYT